MKNNTIGFVIKISFLSLFQCSVFWTYAQLPNLDEVKARFPDATAIYLKKSHEYKITLENKLLNGTCKVHEQVFINKEAGIAFQSRSVSTNEFVQASDIKAFTMVPKNKKYEKKEVEKIELKDSPGKYSFYDDEKIYSIMYPSVQVGAILDLDYQLKYTQPRFMGSFYWTDYIPGVENELVVSVQKNIHIKYKLFNSEGSNIVFTKTETKNEVIYKWKMDNVDPIVQFGDAPSFTYYEPHIIFYITDYEVDGKPQQLLGTPKDLYSWYCALQKNINKTEDKRLKSVTDSLVAGITDESEKVKKIFYWVQDNISYVAFEDGLGGFIPRDAGTVCSRKFGDCKDMASIIHEMLRMAGVNSYLTWIGSRDIPYTYEEVPTPSVDNHMITTYLDKNGNWNFLDGTGKNAPADLYTSMIQGKQALISISPDSFKLVTVPIKDTSVSQTIDSIFIHINDNLLVGKGNVKMTGYDKLEYYYKTENLSKKEALDYFRSYFSKGSNKVNFFDVVITKIDRTSGGDITYSFDLSDYVKRNQNEIYINLNMENSLHLEQVDETRKIPVSFKHNTKKRLVTTFTIPDGYQPEFIPPSARYGNEIAGYTSTYELKNNTIIHVNDFYINTLLLNSTDFSKYNKVLTEMVKANKQAVSLIKK